MRSLRTRRAKVVVAVVATAAVVMAAAGCGGSDSDAAVPRTERGQRLRWVDCGSRVQCAALDVPLDWDAPDGRTITLAIYRRRATGNRSGSVVVNPGGPGAPARPLIEQAADVFTDRLREHFDIVGWDPRGTGRSSPVTCGSHLDPFTTVDHTPDSGAEVRQNVEAAKAFVRECERRSGWLLPHVGTDDTVRDLDAVRAALGESRLDYFGFSYGTYIGAKYAEAYPNRVRSMVLDGPVDPSTNATDVSVAQSVAFEANLNEFLDDCAARPQCGFRSGRAGFASLVRRAETDPMRVQLNDERRTLGPSELRLGVSMALYGGRDAWTDLAKALEAADRGDAKTLLRMNDAYNERSPGGTYSNALAGFYAVTCLDGQGSRSLEEVQSSALESARAGAPVLGPDNAWMGLPCAYWPVPPRPVRALSVPDNIGPVLVVAGTHDPATPYRWGTALASQLHAGLLTVDTDQHTSYSIGSSCVTGAVDAYIESGRLPSERTC